MQVCNTTWGLEGAIILMGLILRDEIELEIGINCDKKRDDPHWTIPKYERKTNGYIKTGPPNLNGLSKKVQVDSLFTIDTDDGEV